MKNKFFGVVLPAIMLVFGFVGTGCKDAVQEKGSTPVLLAEDISQTPTITVQPQGNGYGPGALAERITIIRKRCRRRKALLPVV